MPTVTAGELLLRPAAPVTVVPEDGCQNEPSDPPEVLDGLLTDLRPLPVNSCAYLDLARRE